MTATKELISELNTKVDALLTHYHEQREAARIANQEIGKLKSELAEKEQQITSIKTELEKKPAVQPVEKDAVDHDQLKLRINELVQEIDECISLLKA